MKFHVFIPFFDTVFIKIFFETQYTVFEEFTYKEQIEIPHLNSILLSFSFIISFQKRLTTSLIV